MKEYIQFKVLLQWAIAMLLFAVLASCTKVDVSDPFVKGGEFTYPAKADSVLARGGKYRLELSWLLISDPKITKYKVYWNNRRDSVVGDVVRTHSVDTVRIMFNNWEEGIYNFDIYTYDKHGNSSVKASVVGRVYGDFYQSGVLTRTFRTVNKVGSKHYQINWMEAEPEFHSADVSYIGSDGQMKKVVVKNVDIRTELMDFPNWGGEFSYVAKFLPEPKALDTFYAKPVVRKLPEFSWHNYSVMFSHFGDLMVQDQNGDLFKFKVKPDGTFDTDLPVSFEFGAFVAASYKHELFSITRGGQMRRSKATMGQGVDPFAIYANGYTFDKIMSLPSGIVTRHSSLKTLYFYGYTVANGKFEGPNKAQFATGYGVYDELIYVSSGAMIAKKPTGELYRIAITATVVNLSTVNITVGTATLIATGWTDVDYMGPMDNSILVRKKNDEMWIYPMNGTALGTGRKLVADID